MYFLKLYYKFLDWEWYTNANVMRLFIHCLLKANVKPKKWNGILIKRGSFVTSYQHLAKELGLSVQQVRTAMQKLESTQEITRQVTRNQQGSNTMIIINNYNEYQPNNKQDNTRITLEQHSNNTQITTTKECKNDKNDKSVNNNQKIDPFVNSIKEFFISEYKRIFGIRPAIYRDECIKLAELAEDDKDIYEHITIAIQRLKHIKFDFDKGDTRKPKCNWLLSNNNFAKVVNGEFGEFADKQTQQQQEEQERKKRAKQELWELNPELAKRLEEIEKCHNT